MIAIAKSKTICVVDSQRDDYASLVRAAPQENAKIAFFDNARAALRAGGRAEVDVWVVNMDLPDMSGLDLQEMLRSRHPGVPVYLVGETYAPEDEIRARSSGAAMFFWKPVQSEWLLGTMPAAAAGAG